MNKEEENSEEMDNLEEYLEYLTRMTPTTLPEWMD
jgi:hypothetical protein